MKRFILVSFGFLGWAFYEMSGGSAFDADDMRTARLEAIELEKSEKAASRARAAEALVVAKAPAVFVDTDPPSNADVTRVSLNLASVDSRSNAAAPIIQQAEDASVPQNITLVTSSNDTPAIIPSLIDPTDGAAVSQSEAVQIPTSAAEDVRTVTGNRVNVRGGPGTDFGIVSRLARGDAVKVIQDDGNGWVRFETLDGAPGGWMADFLLTNG